jgi:hypothetical protein
MAILEDLDRRAILRRTEAGHVPGPRASTIAAPIASERIASEPATAEPAIAEPIAAEPAVADGSGTG